MASSEGKSSDGFVRGLLIGLIISMAVICIGSLAGYVTVQELRRAARTGWNTRPIIIAYGDVAPGERLVLEKLSQRWIPEQFITRSMVTPDSASLVANAELRTQLREGDPVRWVDVEDSESAEPVLFATRDIAPGTLVVEDVVFRWVPKKLVTRSWVNPESERIVGRTVVVPFKKGDPILWTHVAQRSFSGGEQP